MLLPGKLSDPMGAARFFKLLVCFKKPKVINLSYIPVLIKNKPVLFVVWEVGHAWSVKFVPLNYKSYTASHALALSIPEELPTITLRVSNFWRKKSVELNMRAVALDEAAAARLIHGFRPLNTVTAVAPLVLDIKNKAALKPISIQQPNCSVKNIHRFKINIQPFNYP